MTGMERNGRITRRGFMRRAGVVVGSLPLAKAAFAQEASAPATGFVYDPIYLKHLTGAGHPESPARLTMIHQGLTESKLIEKLTPIPADDCPLDVLELVHAGDYVELVKRECGNDSRTLSTGEAPVCRDSYAAAVRAAGGLLRAVDAVIAGKVRNVFCAVRPPGHHSSDSRGTGFCVFNNVAIAARYAQKKHGLKRVLIADWDVHHGNGTQDTFYEDGSVLFFSTHQWPWYPGTGREDERGSGPGEGLIVNCPMPAGSGNAELKEAFETKLVPAADKFRPELVLISAGFDSRAGDPLGRFQVTDDGFRALTKIVIGIAERHAKGRLVSSLEGGYNLPGLASAVGAHIETLLGA